jgi:hypothetical protein
VVLAVNDWPRAVNAINFLVHDAQDPFVSGTQVITRDRFERISRLKVISHDTADLGIDSILHVSSESLSFRLRVFSDAPAAGEVAQFRALVAVRPSAALKCPQSNARAFRVAWQ